MCSNFQLDASWSDFFFKLFIYLFIFGCVGSSLLHAGFLQLGQVGASPCGGFSCCGAQALGTWASVVAAHGLRSCGLRALECRLSSCGARASLLHGMWDLPRPRLKPVSPALAGRFLTMAPPGKPPGQILMDKGMQMRCKTLVQHYSP